MRKAPSRIYRSRSTPARSRTASPPGRIARGLAYAAQGDTQHACRLPSYLSLSPEANDRALVETWIVDLS
jgi:hypothetical protein